MAHALTTAGSPLRRRAGVSPLCGLACGVLLTVGAGLIYWLENAAPVHRPTAADQTALAEAASARALKRLRDREAQARAEMARQEAEERARRTLLVDGQREGEARRQREEIAARRAEAAEAQRAAAETEEAWKRFYRPSPECREPASSTRIECVNEFVKAKREFHARAVASPN
jgi:hypothetical protein